MFKYAVNHLWRAIRNMGWINLTRVSPGYLYLYLWVCLYIFHMSIFVFRTFHIFLLSLACFLIIIVIIYLICHSQSEFSITYFWHLCCMIATSCHCKLCLLILSLFPVTNIIIIHNEINGPSPT